METNGTPNTDQANVENDELNLIHEDNVNTETVSQDQELNLDSPENEETRGQKITKFFATMLTVLKQVIASIFQTIGLFFGLLFGAIGGGDLTILKTLPSKALATKAGLGALMLVVAGIAGVMGAHAFSTFKPEASHSVVVAVGVIWAILILLIDRILIMADDSQKAKNLNAGIEPGKYANLWLLLKRAPLVLILSYIISTSAEMLIFEPEINAIISEKRDDERELIFEEIQEKVQKIKDERVALAEDVSDKADEHRAYIAGLDQEVTKLEEQLERLNQQLIGEVQGEIGSGRRGKGPAAEEIEKAIAETNNDLAAKLKRRDSLAQTSITFNELETQKEFQKERNLELDEKLARIKEDEQRRLDNVEVSIAGGFLARYIALKDLKNKNPESWLMIWAVFGFFLVLEMLPITIKTFLPKGSYVKAVAAQFRIADNKRKTETEATILENNTEHYNLVKSKGNSLAKLQEAIAKREAKKSEVIDGINRKKADQQKTDQVAILDSEKELFDKEIKILKEKAATIGQFKTSINSALQPSDDVNFTLEEEEQMAQIYALFLDKGTKLI